MRGKINVAIKKALYGLQYTNSNIITIPGGTYLISESLEIQKDIKVTEETKHIDIELTKENTKIGEVINKPIEYWYEIELNPDTKPQTVIGYDETGEKIFVLYPEGNDKQ